MHDSTVINKLLYPILFENEPVKRAEQVSVWIKESKMGFRYEEKDDIIAAINGYSDLSKTIDANSEIHNDEDIKKYLEKIKQLLS